MIYPFDPIETRATHIEVDSADGYVVLDVGMKDPDTGTRLKGAGTLSCLTKEQAITLAEALQAAAWRHLATTV